MNINKIDCDFFLECFNYSRLQVICNLLKDIDMKPFKICPPFRKKLFVKNFLDRENIINDFFVSDYDTAVNDRKVIKKISFHALYYFILDYLNFKYSKYLLADTREHLKYWESLFGKTSAKIFILPVLANTNIYKPMDIESKRDFTVLFYGTFIPLQGVEKIVKAFKILEDKNLNLKFKIIGSGQTMYEITQLVNRLNIQKLQWIKTRVVEEELAIEINKASILLGIFGDSIKARSVVPNKVWQSLACKKCVVTMESPAIREFFDENDLYLVKNNENTIAEAIEKLYKNSSLIKQYEINGYNKFINLYKNTKKSFREFINEQKSNKL